MLEEVEMTPLLPRCVVHGTIGLRTARTGKASACREKSISMSTRFLSASKVQSLTSRHGGAVHCTDAAAGRVRVERGLCHAWGAPRARSHPSCRRARGRRHGGAMRPAWTSGLSASRRRHLRSDGHPRPPLDTTAHRVCGRDGRMFAERAEPKNGPSDSVIDPERRDYPRGIAKRHLSACPARVCAGCKARPSPRRKPYGLRWSGKSAPRCFKWVAGGRVFRRRGR